MRADANLKHSVRAELARHGEDEATVCGRCTTRIDADRAEGCWYCSAYLCAPCWEALGHCGHPEAEEINRVARRRDCTHPNGRDGACPDCGAVNLLVVP